MLVFKETENTDAQTNTDVSKTGFYKKSKKSVFKDCTNLKHLRFTKKAKIAERKWCTAQKEAKR